MVDPRAMPAISNNADKARPAPLQRSIEVAVAAVILLPMLFFPLARDQGLFAYAGQVILDGGVPYQDVFEIKGPAVHYTYALAMAIFGQTAFGIRAFFLLCALAGSQLAAELGGRFVGRAARLPCAMCYALAAVPSGIWAPWNTAQAEDLMLPLSLLAILLIGSPQALRQTRRLAAAGALLGLTCLFKPSGLPVCLAVALVATWRMARDPMLTRRDVAGKLLAASAGFLLPTVAFASYFLMRGALDDFWAMVVLRNVGYVGVKTEGGLWHALKILASWKTVLPATFAAIWLVRERGLLLQLFWAVLLGSWLAVIWQGKYIVYHWTPLVACIAILAGCCAGGLGIWLRRKLGDRVGSRVLATVVAVALPILAVPAYLAGQFQLWSDAGRVACGVMSLEAYREGFRSGASTSAVTSRIAAYLNDRCKPDDTIMVWGHETVINFEADRRAPTRFTIDGALSPAFRFGTEWRAEFMKDMQRALPLYIVIVERDLTLFEKDDSLASLKKFDAFDSFLSSRYEEETLIDRFHIYRRTDGPVGSQVVSHAGTRPI